MKKWLVIALLLPMMAFADTLTIKDTAPETYVVQKGDTLWDISSMYLDKPWLWPELWRNNVHITNPHLIYPGDELRLTYNEQGEPELAIVTPAPSRTKVQLTLSPQGNRQVKSATPINALPWSVIAPYLERASIMDESEYARLPHLLGNQEGAVSFATGDLVLTRADRRQSGRLVITRKQNELYDNEENFLGYQIRHVADATPLDVELEGQWLVEVQDSNFEARRGDKLMAVEDTDPGTLMLEAATDQRGNIVSSLEQHTLLGKYDVVIVDLGADEVKPGTVLGVYQQGPTILDSEQPLYEHENNVMRSAFSEGQEVVQPAIKIGDVVIFKTFEKASYGLITRSTKTIRMGSIVGKP
ncbi:LysM peptidoglycan-binding domain-containing protein [Aestuariibacter halophilus]|uniref:LysM peptidoglycan-binding domain-containing protein n=1 Tax=Fluctibacter halophilus TaxID=226011 RepID=A0ABS8G8M9_9ALTE|nr:LysM domain-containing protein [Aestuariibacter halophilus]MCC2616895.1 LysM peptidoglycan-binding domain-containing protein [Aestuariibacter halophilus]